MPCFEPVTVHDLGLRDDGKHNIRFIGRMSYASSRLDPHLIRVPCGKCIGCRMDRAYMWMVRASLEARDHPAAYFVTLTYDEQNVPRDQLGRTVLDPDEQQRWNKRLRERIGPYRRMVCGEYGGLTGRPHYHAIIYPEHLLILRPLRPEETGYKRPPPGVYQCDELQASWQHGSVRISLATPANIAYTAKYTVKKITDQPDDCDPVDLVDPQTGEVWSVPARPAEFVRSSNRPGLGARYLDDPERLASVECAGTVSLLVGRDRLIRSRLTPTLQRELEIRSPDVALRIKEQRRRRAEIISELKLASTDRPMEAILDTEADLLRRRLAISNRPL